MYTYKHAPPKPRNAGLEGLFGARVDEMDADLLRVAAGFMIISFNI